MRVDLTDVSPIRKTMLIEVEPDEVERETDAVVRGYARRARVPGFRPGKVPLQMVRTMFAKEVAEDVRERVVSRFYQEAAQQKGLHPLGNPVLEDVQHAAGEAFRFRTTFEVLPEIKLKAWRGVEARRASPKVGDEDVARALEELRQRRARLVAVDPRPAETGDVVVAEVDGQPAGGEPFHRDRTLIELGSPDNLAPFNERLVGLAPGQEAEFAADYAADYPAPELAGRRVEYRLKVHEIKRRELPALDDEFAKDLGEFDDLEALRGRVRQDLEARKRGENERIVRQTVLDRVLLENPVLLPDVLVEQELHQRLEDLVRGLILQGMKPDELKLDWEELRKRQEGPARKIVHARLVLDALAASEGLVVDDAELEARLRLEAEHAGESPARVRAKLEKSGGVQALRTQLLREKSLDLLTAVANIQNEE